MFFVPKLIFMYVAIMMVKSDEQFSYGLLELLQVDNNIYGHNMNSIIYFYFN